MKLMVCHISAKEREEAPHATTSTNNMTTNLNDSFVSDLKQRVQIVIDESLMDTETRTPEIDVDSMHFSETGVMIEDDPIVEKVQILADMICRAGDEPAIKSAALLVPMATLQTAPDLKELASSAKRVAFIHCGDLDVYGIVDAHIPVLESELLASS
jgi:hypothetical protein